MAAELFENGKNQTDSLSNEEKWKDFLESLNLFSEDFLCEGRSQGILQKREEFPTDK